MTANTPLYDSHIAAGGKMVDFAGWNMPLNYGSQIEEHHAVRQDAGMFDVSHMTVVDVSGEQAKAFLQRLLANDVAKLKLPGKALYGCMLKPDSGVVDDLIVYYFNEKNYRLVVNAATREKDLEWIEAQAEKFDVTIQERAELAMIAVQGPNARAKTHAVLSAAQAQAADDLKIFVGVECEGVFIARTGYTGEDGYEILVPASEVASLWQALLAQGVRPCGLGARDSLRLEAGMSLYGSDMDESTSPLESGLAWTVALENEKRDFNGRKAIELQQNDTSLVKLVGLVLLDKGVLRPHQTVIWNGDDAGETTSGGFSPTLGRSIALARVSASVEDECQVEIRGKQLQCKVVRPPFVRNGKACIDLATE